MSPLRLAATLVAAALSAALPALVQAQDEAPRKALKVCQDPNNLPFSNTAGAGIENRLAELFGKALGLPVQYYEFPQRMAFVRNTLRYKLPGEDYRCDLMMGVPVGFDQVSVTKPYYRSTYALVIPAGKGLDGVTSTADFLALGKERLRKLRIGVFDRSPASDWLARHDLTDQGVPFRMLDADPARYPGQILEDELAQGRIDAAIVWGPLAGFYAQRVTQPQLKVIPMASEPGVRFDYQMAMGVRYGEKAWKDQIDALIESRRSEIRAILQSYNVPLLDDAPAPSPR
ncbi:MAG: quinoprotein dehydrogenase-associated putative ABC transporter substrate-binding protein [Burkholderiales bacterium]|nr:quinoprotein dehydrogenase-associated putative ABC transporter substrate-binding protein [Burkholderiales bacterium]